jgi:hypothetical protein
MGKGLIEDTNTRLILPEADRQMVYELYSLTKEEIEIPNRGSIVIKYFFNYSPHNS